MARKVKTKSVDERISETRLEIEKTEQALKQLKAQLDDLLHEKDELDMRETWAAIKNKGLSMEDIKKLLEK